MQEQILRCELLVLQQRNRKLAAILRLLMAPHESLRVQSVNLVTAQGTRAARDVKELLSVFIEAREDAIELLSELVDARLLTSFAVGGRPGLRFLLPSSYLAAMSLLY